MKDDVQCPYCKADQEIDHEDGYGYDEGYRHQQECSECGKSFAYETMRVFYHEAFPADCLNEGEHEYKPTITFPLNFTQMECIHCGERRELTESEMKKLKKENGKIPA